MSKLTKIVMALAAVLVVTFGLLAGPASAQDYNGGTVVTAPPSEVDAASASAGDANAAAAVSASGTLPYTGNDSAPIAQIGVALLGAGLIVTLVVRNRTKAAKV
jgi:LPXTG-motif cell wall-anchored protein